MSAEPLSDLPNQARADTQLSPGLRLKREHFDQLVATVEDYAIFTMDIGGHILDWNLGAERIKFYQAKEIVGRHFSCFYSDEDRAAKLPEMELQIASHKGKFTDEGWRYRKDGMRFWANVTITAIRSDDGTVEGFLKITRDLTERRRAMEALRQSDERFRLFLECVQDYAILMLDPEGHVVTWNLGARRIKGYEQAEILGKHFSIFYTPEARAARVPDKLMEKVIRDGRTEDEGWRVRKDGTRFWGNVVITALHDGHGELRGFAKITRDLTDRQQVVALQETDRQKDLFLATLAHELRNPLAPILMGVDLIVQSPDDQAGVRNLADMLKRQVDQMVHLIDELLDMSRIATGKILLKRKLVPLGTIITSARETVASTIIQRQQTLLINVDPEDLMVDADPHRISQVISNLLTNAVKFTPRKGRILLNVSVEPGLMLKISVSDNGKGIPESEQARVFGLFEQVSSGAEGGLGIGLTLVRSIVEMHGGKISLKSEGEGMGSEFTVLLPIVISPQALQPRHKDGVKDDSAIEPGYRPRALVVDDGKSAANILTMFFTMEGIECETAYDGEEATEKVRSFVPDLVCMDIGMPKMNGFEAARAIRRSNQKVVLVALSGWGSEEDRLRSAEAGFDLHLVKPVSPETIRDLIRRYLKNEEP